MMFSSEAGTTHLAATKNYITIVYPKKKESFDFFADVDFCGNWYKLTSPKDVHT